MKYFNCFVFSVFLIFQSCKKDDTGSGGGGGFNYSLKVPSCLLSQVVTDQGTYYYFYDSDKRLIRTTANSDSSLTTYAYFGDQMIETNRYIESNGTISGDTTYHTLNSMGMIGYSLNGDMTSDQYTETFYTYDNDGYLKRELHRSTWIFSQDTTKHYSYYGSYYEYYNGNRTKTWSLNFNSNGEATDSTINSTSTFYTGVESKLNGWFSWTEKKGRPDNNEVMSRSYGSTDVANYTYIYGSNGFPSKLIVKDGNSATFEANLVWKCQ